MSSKALVWIAFAVWSLICWRWYVCGIKEACMPAKAEATIAQQTETPAPMPIEDATPPPAPAPAEKSTQTDTEAVQVIETGDDAEIHCPYNSTEKEQNAAIDAYLSRLAQQLVESGKKVTITGHTDGIGDAKTNLAFAERRAKNIRDILIAKGVNRSQITTKSFGESKPKATNDTPEGRYQNRRVEIAVGN